MDSIAREKIGAHKRGKTYEEMYGVKRAKEIKEKIRLKNKGNACKYVHSPQTRVKMSLAQKKRDKSTRFKIPATLEIIKKREAKKKKNWENLTIEEKHRKLKNFIGAGSKRKVRTSIEERVNLVLKSFGMIEGKNYLRNIQIGGFNVDFLIDDRFIIDCYGDYWHKNPKYFNDTSAEIKRQKDLERRVYLENKGYSFIYFWGEDINNNVEVVIDSIIRYLGQYYNIFEWEACCGYQNV